MTDKITEPLEQYTIRAGERGRLVLPVALRKRIGLQEGDRACLALASTLNLPALTADKAWSDVDADVSVQLIR